ncbi:MAG: hypothetical protein HY281_12275 [Nitrospirae bacterium]|nr:hypothetical protein [Nitrospirota bacterium]
MDGPSVVSLDGRSWTTTDAIPNKERQATLEGSLQDVASFDTRSEEQSADSLLE